MAKAESKSVTIMPGTALNHSMFKMCCDAVRSHKQSTDANLVFIDNPSDNESLQEEMKNFVKVQGYEYVVLKETFSLSRFWNFGFEMVENEYDYVTFSNADVIFYPHWLHYIMEHWNQGDNRTKYFSMHPYVYSPIKRGLNFRDTTTPEHRVIDCDHPQLHVSTFRTEDKYRFDEQYSRWEIDSDYWMWMGQQGRIAGVVLSSRVDHLVGGIAAGLSKVRIDNETGQDKVRFFEKWRYEIRRAGGSKE